MSDHSVSRYVSLCERFNTTMAEIYKTMAEMETIFDENPEGDNDNAGQS